MIFQAIVKSLYSCTSLLQQQFIGPVGETTYIQYFAYNTLTLHNATFILVDVSVITVFCVVLVDAIQFLARENKSEDEIVDVATELCIKLGIEDKLVCTQAVREFKVNPASRFRGAVVSVAPVGVSIVTSSAITAK